MHYSCQLQQTMATTYTGTINQLWVVVSLCVCEPGEQPHYYSANLCKQVCMSEQLSLGLQLSLFLSMRDRVEWGWWILYQEFTIRERVSKCMLKIT